MELLDVEFNSAAFPTSFTVIARPDEVSLGIPVKMNVDSSGKPNDIPLKANRRRSEATLEA